MGFPLALDTKRIGFRVGNFSLGNVLPSVEAWFSSALDIEVVLAGAGGGRLLM